MAANSMGYVPFDEETFHSSGANMRTISTVVELLGN